MRKLFQISLYLFLLFSIDRALRERYNFRILVVGDSSIGKTNLILRFSVNKEKTSLKY